MKLFNSNIMQTIIITIPRYGYGAHERVLPTWIMQPKKKRQNKPITNLKSIIVTAVQFIGSVLNRIESKKLKIKL